MAVAVLVLACACAPHPQPTDGDPVAYTDLGFLNGRFISDRDVWLVHDRFWSANVEQGTWSFKGTAVLWFHVLATPPDGMTVFLHATEKTCGYTMSMRWDDEMLTAEPQRPRSQGDSFEISADRLKPGLHALTVKTIPRLDGPGARVDRDNVFTSLAYEFAGQRYELAPEEAQRLKYMSGFFSRGVTGIGKEKASGCLMDGPRTTSFELSSDGPATASFRVENGSRSPATFTVTVDGVAQATAVEPLQKLQLTLPIDSGVHQVSLDAAGDASGLYMWGAPYLVGAHRELPGPIVLVSLDTTRRDVLSPYGGNPTTSPKIQAFAESATTFEHAYATSPWTLPSHASIFTGLYPARHGAGTDRDHLPATTETLAELLSARGYFTAGFAGGEMCAARWGVAQGFDYYLDPIGFETTGDLLTEAVRAFVANHRDLPLFLFVNYFDPHAMYKAPETFEARFDVPRLRERLAGVPILEELGGGSIDAWTEIVRGGATVADDGLDYLRAAYEAEVAFMDDQIGLLFESLKAEGLYDSALIILVSDHGELLGEKGFFSHSCRLDPELVEIPMIVKWPGQTEGRRVSELVSQVDLFATVLDAAGCAVPANDGLTLTPGNLGPLVERQIVFMEEHENLIHPLFENMKIARHLFGLQELDHREVVWDGGGECARRSASGWRVETCSVPWRDRLDQLAALARVGAEHGDEVGAAALTDADAERLRALGYLK